MFHKQASTSSGYRTRCKVCHQRDNNIWRYKNPYKAKAYKLKFNHGLSIEQYNTMFQQQKGCCKTCSVHMSELPKGWLCVDHDHKTGRIRGLLCDNCNLALGKVQDNVQILKNMIKYLDE